MAMSSGVRVMRVGARRSMLVFAVGVGVGWGYWRVREVERWGKEDRWRKVLLGGFVRGGRVVVVVQWPKGCLKVGGLIECRRNGEGAEERVLWKHYVIKHICLAMGQI